MPTQSVGATIPMQFDARRANRQRAHAPKGDGEGPSTSYGSRQPLKCYVASSSSARCVRYARQWPKSVPKISDPIIRPGGLVRAGEVYQGPLATAPNAPALTRS